MKKRKALVADLLCGAGGSSTGAARALADLGIEMELVCVNHWPVAIDTHQRNHPKARHYCQDIATVRPHLIVPEGYLDLLLASPTCTHHSVARGGKPTSDQQRSDPWHIITWFTELRVKRAIIENVWEFTGWGPVDPKTGKPIKERKGEYFRAWVETIRRLGGEPEWRKLNAADYGDATTRNRFFMMIRFDGKRIAWPMPTHMRRQPGVLPLGLKPWRPARDIIDWNIKGKSIFGRKTPLAPKTLARIYAGAVKLSWPEPFLVILRNHMGAQSVDGPIPTVAARGTHIALAQPIMLANRTNNAAKDPAGHPVPCLTTAHGGGIAVVEPFVIAPGSTGAPRPTGEPLPTITTGGAGNEERPGCARPMLIEPFVMSRQGGGVARSIEEPTPTQVAKHSHVLIAPYYGSGSGETCRSADEPLPSPTTKGRFGMVVPITHSDGSNRARDAEADPLPTITTANRGELAFITAAFGERKGQAPRTHDLGDPAPTICAHGRVNLVEAAEGYDILFRMLEPHELAAAMGFTDEETTYEFAGTKTEKIKQIGNAVPVNTASALVKAVMNDVAMKRREQPQRKAVAA